MAKIVVPVQYSVRIDRELVFSFNGEESQGAFVLTQVGGEYDGTVVAIGPARMGIVLNGMMRLAAFGHGEIQHEGQEYIDHVLRTGKRPEPGELGSKLWTPGEEEQQ